MRDMKSSVTKPDRGLRRRPWPRALHGRSAAPHSWRGWRYPFRRAHGGRRRPSSRRANRTWAPRLRPEIVAAAVARVLHADRQPAARTSGLVVDLVARDVALRAPGSSRPPPSTSKKASARRRGTRRWRCGYTLSMSAIGSVIVTARAPHHQELFVMPGTSPACAIWRRHSRQSRRVAVDEPRRARTSGEHVIRPAP